MSHQTQLDAVELSIANDYKHDPTDLKPIFSLLNDLRKQDGNEQLFQKDLATINKDLVSKQILPNLQIVEAPNIADGFKLLPLSDQSTQSQSPSASSGSDASSTPDEQPWNDPNGDGASTARSGGGGGSRSSGGGAGGDGPSGTSGAGGGSSSGGDGPSRSSGGDGGSSSASATSDSAPPNTVQDVPSGPLAERLIAGAEAEMQDPTVEGGHKGGHCLAGVRVALEHAGMQATGGIRYAKDYANVLAKDSQFSEVPANGPLQPGDIIVHSGTPNCPAGHIAIVMPGGREISDTENKLMLPGHLGKGDVSRVFRPKG